MNEVLIKLWNDCIGPTDVVYHLGDVALGDFNVWDSIFNRLNGYKILVEGNHDRIFGGAKASVRDKYYDDYAKWFDEIESNMKNVGLGFASDGIGHEFYVNLSHFPYDGDHTRQDRYSEFRLPDDGRPLIHGHTHSSEIYSRSKKGTPQVHVGVDAWSYGPVSEVQALEALRMMEKYDYLGKNN